jgi:hypothetical protein
MPQQPERSKAETDALAVLAACLANNPLPEEKDIGFCRTDSDAAQNMHCIALIKDGKIIPYIDLEEIPEPKTVAEKMGYMAFIARRVLDGLMNFLLSAEERHQKQDKTDNDEGEASHA